MCHLHCINAISLQTVRFFHSKLLRSREVCVNVRVMASHSCAHRRLRCFRRASAHLLNVAVLVTLLRRSAVSSSPL